MRTWRFAAIFLASMLLGANAGAAPNPQVWLAPWWRATADFMDMFTPNAPWRAAASHVQVFELYPGFVQRASDDQVAAAISDLNRRGIAIGLEVGVINVPGNPAPVCGGMGRVEGYGTVNEARLISEKIKRAGGQLRYIAMDEPFYFGHYYTFNPRLLNGGHGCHSPVSDVAALVAPVVNTYLSEFPNVNIGDIEPTGYIERNPNWQNELNDWVHDYRAAIGRPLSFMQLDISWNSIQDGQAFYAYTQELVRRGLVGRIGVIYNGMAADASDEAWVRDARNHILAIEKDHGLHPDDVIFQSWNSNPTHAMPDSGASSLTSLVTFYFSPAVMALTGRGQ